LFCGKKSFSKNLKVKKASKKERKKEKQQVISFKMKEKSK
jgi:hypothetical protein